MRFQYMLRIGLVVLIGAVVSLVAKAQDAAPVIEELEAAQAPKAAAAAAPVEEKAEAKEAPKAADAPVIEELAPEEAPKAAAAAAPAEEKAEAKEAPKVADAPVIEELAPAEAPKAVADAPKAAAPGIEELEPAPTGAAAPVKAPVVATRAEPAPAVRETAPGDIKTEPDAGTKQALEAAMSAPRADDRTKVSVEVSDQESVRRKTREIEGLKAMAAADEAWKRNDYAAAAESYKMVLTKLPNVERCMVMRNRANQRLTECDYEIVRALVGADKIKEAAARGDEYLKVRPSNVPLRKLMAKINAIKDAPPPKVPVGGERVSDPEVDKQMQLGREAMAGRDYAEARRRFESVLGLEPDHREAMRYLKVLGDREYGNKSAERDATAKKMTADVRDGWNSKYKVIKGRPQNVTQTQTQTVSVIEEKMKKIIIDEVEFRQANMHDVVDFLNKRSRDCDHTVEDQAKKGVNIILNLNPGGNSVAPAAPKAAPEDPFGAAPEAGKGGGAIAGVPEVTFSARFITLFNALKIITSVSGLKWSVDGDVVMIVPFDWDPSIIEMRMYPVEPTFIDRVKVTSMGMAQTTQIGGREVEAIEPTGGGEVVGDLKAYFQLMGMKFPPGSSISYNPGIGKVIIANTSANLLTFEKLLAELNVLPLQVEIEAKFVEVNETDLYEAGLEWLLTDNWEMAVKNGGNPYAPMTSNPRIQMNANSADGGFTKGLHFLGTQDGKPTPMAGGKGSLGSIASIAGVFTNPDLTVILHALEQNGNADLLSAPKVTARSGEAALIKVVTEYIYPTTFEVQGGQIGTSSGTDNAANIVQETTVVPQDFATREVGVILEVTPEVSPDGNTINLAMTPKVVTDPIWYQYGSSVRRADGSVQVLNMPQPFFQVRAIETKISIYDGATVAMGGLITESVEKVNDKIPVLGDIPFIGALFRSKSERSVKKNLLIFVTAKLVDPSGHQIRGQGTDASKATAPGATPPGAAPAAPGPGAAPAPAPAK